MKALVTGITGQDGSYLAEFLLAKDYEVHGMYRRSSTDTTGRIKHLLDNPNFHLHYGDMTDSASLNSLVALTKPDEIYNLAAQSDVGVSFKVPVLTADVNAVGVLRLLEAMKTHAPKARFYQASTSEMFGNGSPPYDEDSLFDPASPYGWAKLYAHGTVKTYRDGHNLYACSGILFNHESPRRGDNFVTQKIVKQMTEIFRRERTHIELGNLDARRDWGFAGDYVEAMWLMLQQQWANDYVIATGKAHSVRDFVEETAKCLDMEIVWEGEGKDEIGRDKKTGDMIIKVNPKFYRPVDIEELVGLSLKAWLGLEWQPKTSFRELVKLMVESEL